jgi:hypothetical protein
MATCLLLMVIGLSLGWLLWRQSQQTAARERAMVAEVLTQSQKLQQEMLKQLQELSKSAQSPKSPDWIPVSFRLTQEKTDGPPAPRISAALGRGNNGTKKDDAIFRESDPGGLVDFGVVQPGDWEFSLWSKGYERDSWRAIGKLNVLPGSNVEKTIVCPRFPLGNVPVTIRVDWPPDLAEQELQVAIELHHQGFDYEPPLRWIADIPTTNVLCGSGSKLVMESFPGLFFWRHSNGSESGIARRKPVKTDQVFVDVRGSNSGNSGAPVALRLGKYAIESLVVMKPVSPPATLSGGRRYALHSWSGARQKSRAVLIYDNPPDDRNNPVNGMLISFRGQENLSGVPVSDDHWNAIKSNLEAVEGKSNEWTITLPEEMVKEVRERVKVDLKPIKS